MKTPQPVANAYRAALRLLRPAVLGVFAFSAVLNVLMLTGSIYMLQIYDRVLSSGSVPTLLGLFAVVIVLYAFFGFYTFLRVRLLSRAALRLDASLGGAAFDRGLHAGLPGGADRNARAGNARVLGDLGTVRKFLSGPAVTALADMPFAPLFLVALFLIHPWLGWLTVAGVGVAAALALLNRAITKAALQASGQHDIVERDFTTRSRRNAEAIFAMGMGAAVGERWRAVHQRTLSSAQNGSDPSEMLVAGSRAFRMLLQSAILTLGALLVLRGEISAGMIIASSILSGRVLAPVDQFIGQWRSIGQAMAAHRRLSENFEVPLASPARIALPDPTGAITVEGLIKLRPGAQEAQADAPRILSDVSFALQPGDGLGVVGNSASGKSTLARLLTGAMQGDAGEIRFDGATPDQWDPQQLGRNIGYLPQVVEMLPGSIRDNIARFDPEASDDAVMAAARLTGIHDMILKLPDGYATMLCDPARSLMLSGGQMQRLGLARAVYGMPRIVVLDEPNSNLDIAGDAALTQAIQALRAAGSSVVVMAHRPSALTAVNKLMVLDAGVVRVFGDKEKVLSEGLKVRAPAPVAAAEPARPTPAPAVPVTGPAFTPEPAEMPAMAASLSGPARALAKARAKRKVLERDPAQDVPTPTAEPIPLDGARAPERALHAVRPTSQAVAPATRRRA